MKRLSLLLAAKQAPMLIGGQAVMEGVMMKSKHHIATSVRKQDGSIKTRHRKERSFAERTGLDKVPFVRGAVILFETLIIGLRELNWSASEAFDEDEKLSTWELALTMAVAILFALALFKLLPLFIASLITSGADGGNWMLNVLDGLIKLGVFILYLVIIGQFGDMKRLFAYHGAEHKAVNCYEDGRKLTPRNAQKHTRLQARCGTTFVIYVIFLSIIFYLFIPFGSGFWTKYAWRLLLLPVIAGVAYEWIRYAGLCYSKYGWVRAISAPGMLFQHITTREPNLKQLEVSIASLKRVLDEERKERDPSGISL